MCLPAIPNKEGEQTYGICKQWPGRLQFLEVVVILLGLMPGWMCADAPGGFRRASLLLRLGRAAHDLLTDGAHTLDVAAHVYGKSAGQVHNDVHSWT